MAQPPAGTGPDRNSRMRPGAAWGAPIQAIRPGDVVWIAPGEKHWHGAAATTAMTHIAIVEQLDGKSADWMEHVSDEQYQTDAPLKRNQ